MRELTEKEIDLISGDIDRRGLTYTYLKVELLDHICCDIEAEMEKGLTFNEAYRKVKQLIGKKRIRQIQDETLYLISKKYRIMKRLMYVLGIAVPILIVTGAVLRVMHLPGGGPVLSLALLTVGVFFIPVFVLVRIRDTRKLEEPVPMGLYLTGMIAAVLTSIGSFLKVLHLAGGSVMTTLGLFTLAAVFLPMYVVVKMRYAREKKESFNKAYYIAGVIVGILFIAGALFKTMHWPGAGVAITVSWISVAVLFLPVIVLNVLKQVKNRVDNFFYIILAASFVAIFLLTWLRLGPSRIMLDEFITNEEGYAETALYLGGLNDRLLLSATQSGSGEVYAAMKDISAQADRICDLIEEAKREMVLETDNRNQAAIGEDKRIDFRQVWGIDDDNSPDHVMIGPGGQGGKAFELKSQLESFIDQAISACPGTAMKQFTDEHLDMTLPPESGRSWEEYYFSSRLVQTANHLSRYEAAVRVVESKVLTELADRP